MPSVPLRHAACIRRDTALGIDVITRAHLPKTKLLADQTTMSRNLIVFSHLPWNFVYQRLQHVLSRLAKHYRVLFVEEPLSCDGEARLDLSSPLPGCRCAGRARQPTWVPQCARSTGP